MENEPLSYTVLMLQKLAIEAQLERMEKEAAILRKAGIAWEDLATRERLAMDITGHLLTQPSPRQVTLARYIEAMDVPTARAVTTLAYAGRDQHDSIRAIRMDVGNTPEERTKDFLMVKLDELHALLFLGLQRFGREGFFLEALCAPLDTPPKPE